MKQLKLIFCWLTVFLASCSAFADLEPLTEVSESEKIRWVEALLQRNRVEITPPGISLSPLEEGTLVKIWNDIFGKEDRFFGSLQYGTVDRVQFSSFNGLNNCRFKSGFRFELGAEKNHVLFALEDCELSLSPSEDLRVIRHLFKYSKNGDLQPKGKI